MMTFRNAYIVIDDAFLAEKLEKALGSHGLEGVAHVVSSAPDDPSDDDFVFHLPPSIRLGAVMDRILEALKSASSATEKGVSFRLGRYSFYPHHHSLVQENGQDDVRLTEKESALLSLLCGSGGVEVSRHRLLSEVWGYAESVETRTLETHIYRLRQKIEDDSSNPQILLTTQDGYQIFLS